MLLRRQCPKGKGLLVYTSLWGALSRFDAKVHHLGGTPGSADHCCWVLQYVFGVEAQICHDAWVQTRWVSIPPAAMSVL
jgi:hypothetical protein